jgi:hypothetical protein
MSAHAFSSERRLAANRANAQLSTGPRTEAGKAVSSLNAVKTGLTGRAVLLPSEDAEAYETHLLQYVDAFAPVSARETELVQSLADTQWRLNRIPNLEAGLFALGRMRCAELFTEEQNPQIRRAMIDAHILVEDAKHFKNLHLQESRLSHRYNKDLKALKELQTERKKQEEEGAKQTEKPKALAAANGFEFTTPAEQPGGKAEIKTNGQTNNSVLSQTGAVRPESPSVLRP